MITKEQGKGKWALPRNLRRLLTTIWQRKAVWKTLLQNKSGGTINPVYLPQTTPEQNKEGVNKNTLSISNLAQYFILQLMRNVPWTTMTSIELRLLNTCCITQKVRCWGGNNQKGTAKEQGHGRMTYKVFSLNPLYQIEEDMLVFYARNIYFPQKEHGKGTSKRGKKKHVASKSFRSWIWRHPNKQPCNRPNRAETKREKAKDARKKSLDEVSAKHTTWILT